MDPSGCFSIDYLLRFFAGRLPEAELHLVDVHLEACQRCRQLLDEVARSAAPDAAPPLPALSEEIATFAPNTTIQGRYTIQRFIASGGMGEVYQATDNLINEQVALKTVRANLRGDPGALERLQRELRLARRVAHPNVCRVFDFAVGDNTAQSPGVAFLTMEFLQGETLRVVLKRERMLDAARALDIWGGMVRGLQAAHAVGVIHRDLKPDNVMLVDGGAGKSRAVITDFGLARAVRADLTWNSGSGLVGTVGYIAPEQVLSRKVTAAADVYAAGVVLYEMLTGRIPDLTATGAMTDSHAEIAAAPLRLTDSTLSARARNLAVTCLNLVPARRPSLQQLIEALGRIDVERSAAPRPTWRRWLWPAPAATRWAVAGAAVVAVAIIAGGITTFARRAQPLEPATAAAAVTAAEPKREAVVPAVGVEAPPATAPTASVQAPAQFAPAPTAPAARTWPAPTSRARRRAQVARVEKAASLQASPPSHAATADDLDRRAPPRQTAADPSDIVRRLDRIDLPAGRDVLLNPFRE